MARRMRCGACMTCMTSMHSRNPTHEEEEEEEEDDPPTSPFPFSEAAAAGASARPVGAAASTAGAATIGWKCSREHAVIICAAKPAPPAIQDATATTLTATTSPMPPPPPPSNAAEPVRNATATTTAHPATLRVKHAHPNACNSMNRSPPAPGCQKFHVSAPHLSRPPTPYCTGTAIAKHAKASVAKMSRAAGVACKCEWCAVSSRAVPASASAQHSPVTTYTPVVLAKRVKEGLRLCPRRAAADAG
mmetsp:Transcript_21328/g.52949  ORF Transcript_21328/g.52949 Transcript_21328/m.52949 type:complete len:247 (+) Transcript_21328:290-1030(+)